MKTIKTVKSERASPIYLVNKGLTRRQMLRGMACTLAGVAISKLANSSAAPAQPAKLAEETLAFIRRCARPDGGYDPSPDPAYEGNSDTRLSDLAGVTYAATLAKTMGWELPHPERSIDYVQRRQQPDGSFIHLAGKMDPKSDAAVLYNTVQGAVALRALGERPKIDPSKVMDRFFAGDAFKKLPWYTTSFFPLFYAALGNLARSSTRQPNRRWISGRPCCRHLPPGALFPFGRSADAKSRADGRACAAGSEIRWRLEYQRPRLGRARLFRRGLPLAAIGRRIGASPAIDREGRRLGADLSQFRRRLRTFSQLALRYGCGLLSARHLNSSGPRTFSQTRFARRPYVELGPRHGTGQAVLSLERLSNGAPRSLFFETTAVAPCRWPAGPESYQAPLE